MSYTKDGSLQRDMNPTVLFYAPYFDVTFLFYEDLLQTRTDVVLKQEKLLKKVKLYTGNKNKF